MATQNDNPYKKYKKSLKGAKLGGDAVHAMMKKKASGPIKTSGSFGGKSNALGQGGRASQLKARGVPGGVIGNLARAAQAAPGQKNFHKKKRKAGPTVRVDGGKDPEHKKKRKGVPTVRMDGGKDPEHKKKRKASKNDHDADDMKRKTKKKSASK